MFRSIKRIFRGISTSLVCSVLVSLAIGTVEASERIAAGPLQCDFEGYEGVLRYEDASRRERETYALGMGFAHHGSKEIHELLRERFASLTFDPIRAPILSADLASGQLHVFDCASQQCSRQEIAYEAPQACQTDLGARQCMTFAVRVDGIYYCTLGPGLGQ